MTRPETELLAAIAADPDDPDSQLVIADWLLAQGDPRGELIVAVLSDAIRAGTPFPELRFPFMRDPLPVYEGGARRVYRLPLAFTHPRGIERDRYGLAARDYHRWHALWHRLETS